MQKISKVTQYLHVSDRANELACNSPHYNKWNTIHPVLNMICNSFAESYKPGKNS